MIRIVFDDGATRLYNCAPLIEPGTVFANLASSERFRRVYVDENGDIAWDIDPDVDSAAVWGNKIDISSDACYVYGTAVDG